MTINVTVAIHHRGSQAPSSANGSMVGFNRMSAAGHPTVNPSTTSAATHIDVPPTISWAELIGCTKQSAMSGHAHTAGRHRTMARTTIAIGMAHQATTRSGSGTTVSRPNTGPAAGG